MVSGYSVHHPFTVLCNNAVWAMDEEIMQYLLTKEELDSLNNQIDHAKRENILLVQSLCTQVCDNKSIKFWGNKKARPWGCIHSTTEEWYCDECPVQEVCPETHKHWSK